MNKDLKVGQRVRLDPLHGWSDPATNPIDCEGEVTEPLYVWVRVKWDNGSYNSYRPTDSDLIPID